MMPFKDRQTAGLEHRFMSLGFFVGFFSAGIGIGGGTLLVSLLISVFKIDFKRAAALSLSTIIPISFVGAVGHFWFMTAVPDLSAYFIFIPACMAGIPAGGLLMRNRPNQWLKAVFSVFLLIVSLRMLQIVDSPSLIFFGLRHSAGFSHWLIVLTVLSVGFFTGMISVLLGIGCGLLIVPFFVIVMDFTIHQAIPLSLTTMFFLALSGTIVNNRLKFLNSRAVIYLAGPALAGAVFGAMLSSQLPAFVLKKLFGIFLFAIACHYIITESNLRHRPRAARKCAAGNGSRVSPVPLVQQPEDQPE